MALFTMTYGQMPTREQFDQAWEKTQAEGDLRDGEFHFGNDKRLGTCALTQNQLWIGLVQAHEEYEALLEGDTDKDPEMVGEWISSVLGCLSIEWV